MASVGRRETVTSPRAPLLLYLGRDADLQRFSVGPALAAAAQRAGWRFDCYYDARRAGRHFGGGDPALARPGWASGSLLAGGGHLVDLARLASRFHVVAVGDPDSAAWPALDDAGVESVARSTDPVEIYEAVFRRMDQPIPGTVLVLDAGPQGPHGVVVAPYLFPAFLGEDPVIGVDVSSEANLRRRIEALGASRFVGRHVDQVRADAFPGGLPERMGAVDGEGYAAVTASLGLQHARWGRGVILGDPQLVAAQLPKAARLRLVPLYGRPQTDVIDRAADLVRAARDPVFGRQYDDRDFFSLARHGRGFQLLDPAPPFDALERTEPAAAPSGGIDAEPSDAQLERWAEDRAILVTVLFWSGMIRELECAPRIVDLMASTGLRAGLVVTTETIAYASDSLLGLLATPIDRGGVGESCEVLLASTGRGVAAESFLPPDALRETLSSARADARQRLPDALSLRGWWPLLDTSLAVVRAPRVRWKGRRPTIQFAPRGGAPARGGSSPRARRDVRGLLGDTVRRAGLDRFFEERRPFDASRPGPVNTGVAEAVRDSGFSYMWSKAAFGTPAVPFRSEDFVALSLTAGRWGGWSPFYTVSHAGELIDCERRLDKLGRPGWVAATIDTPLWALSGEILEHGGTLHGIAGLAARGGSEGRLINVTPNVVARYARVLLRRGLIGSDPHDGQHRR